MPKRRDNQSYSPNITPTNPYGHIMGKRAPWMGFGSKWKNDSNIGDQIGTAFDKITGAWQVDKTNQANIELSKYQFEMEKKMIDLQNQYNSALSQMNRYKEAGLNPNLMYSQGDAGTQQGHASYEKPNIDYSGYKPERILEVLGNFQNMNMRKNQIANVKAQNESIRQDALSKTIDNALKAPKVPYAKGRAMLENSILDESLYNYQLDNKQKEWQYNFNNPRQIKQMDLENDFKKNRNDLAKIGIYQSDNPLLRTLAVQANEAGVPLSTMLEQLIKKFKK